jgi:hypothetical protein
MSNRPTVVAALTAALDTKQAAWGCHRSGRVRAPTPADWWSGRVSQGRSQQATHCPGGDR